MGSLFCCRVLFLGLCFLPFFFPGLFFMLTFLKNYEYFGSIDEDGIYRLFLKK